jgi:hypothetical protein
MVRTAGGWKESSGCAAQIRQAWRRCGGFCSLRSVTAMAHFPPSAWNGSWNDAPDNPSAAGAVSAMTCAIIAASAHGARGRTSCKRQVSGSNPLTGSQWSSRFSEAYFHAGLGLTFPLVARVSWAGAVSGPALWLVRLAGAAGFCPPCLGPRDLGRAADGCRGAWCRCGYGGAV